MTPRDFFLRGREISGFLIPGVIWMIAALLLTLPSSLDFWLDGGNPGWMIVSVFLLASYLLGYSVAPLSFALSERVGRRMPRLLRRIRPEQNVAELAEKTRRVLEIPDSGDEALFGYCKRLMRLRWDTAARHFDVYEIEINLLAMLPPPLVLFALSWILAWFRTEGMGVMHALLGSLFSLWLALAFVELFMITRAAEKRECYETFLILSSSDDAKNLPSQTGGPPSLT